MTMTELRGVTGSREDRETRQARILVIQPQSLVRQGMVGLLDNTDDMQVIAHTGSADHGIDLAREFQPDVVIVDIDRAEDDSDNDNDNVVPALREALEDGRVLVLADGAPQARVERSLAEGAGGYMLKEIPTGEFLEAIRRLADGELVLHPEATIALARSFSPSGNGSAPGAAELTARQREIVQLLVAGFQNKQIARKLGIGVETVKTHVSRIIDRLGVSSRTEVAVVALRDGLVA